MHFVREIAFRAVKCLRARVDLFPIILPYYTSRIRRIRLISLDAQRQISHAHSAHFTSAGYFTVFTIAERFPENSAVYGSPV